MTQRTPTEMMDMIEDYIRKNNGATCAQLVIVLQRSPATIGNYLRDLWVAGRIKRQRAATPRTKAFWVIGREPNAGNYDISAEVRVTVQTWPPNHKRGVLECLWFGVPAAMVIG